MNGSRTRWLVLGLIVVLAACGAVAMLLAPRIRARLHPGWIEGKNLTLAPSVTGLQQPTYVAGVPDGSHRLAILERAGGVRIASADGQLSPTSLLDLTAAVSTAGNEQGLLGLAFDPDFQHTGYLYVDYTAKDDTVRVIRYAVSGQNRDRIDPSSAETVLSLPKHSRFHNGGMLAFGPDGFLYVGVGDDESSEQAQNLDSLFGKILRLDVDHTGAAGQPYSIPVSNPFVGQPGAMGEIWAYGLRNPWRFSFDRATGDLWIGDVGDATWEEIDFQPSTSAGGENYGWPTYEGTECRQPEHCQDAGLVTPVATYGHDMNCAVMAGYVYRGASARGLVGHYLYGDLCTGGIFSLRSGADPAHARLELGYRPIHIASFGEDPDGAVYVSDIGGGTIYRIADGSVP